MTHTILHYLLSQLMEDRVQLAREVELSRQMQTSA